MKPATPSRSLSAIKDTKISLFIKTLPHLDITEKGLNTVSKRLGITIEKMRSRMKKQLKENRNGE